MVTCGSPFFAIYNIKNHISIVSATEKGTLIPLAKFHTGLYKVNYKQGITAK